MGKGINRALLTGYTRAVYEHNVEKGRCIFISHKSDDKPAAMAIANAIMNAGIDVFIDVNDTVLQRAVEQNNNEQIVEEIERAMEVSTDILVIISEKTKKSWWVPYEIGYSKRGDTNITSLILKEVNVIPEYLKIEPIIHTIEELQKYIASKSRYGLLFESKIEIRDKEKLYDYLES